jgi:hypothetical protein
MAGLTDSCAAGLKPGARETAPTTQIELSARSTFAAGAAGCRGALAHIHIVGPEGSGSGVIAETDGDAGAGTIEKGRDGCLAETCGDRDELPTPTLIKDSVGRRRHAVARGGYYGDPLLGREDRLLNRKMIARRQR